MFYVSETFENYDLIREELKNYSWQTIYEFHKFQRKYSKFKYKYVIDDIEVNNIIDNTYFLEMNTVKKFWTMWNKYKKIRLFI